MALNPTSKFYGRSEPDKTIINSTEWQRKNLTLSCGEPDTYPPTKRPEITIIDGVRMKMGTNLQQFDESDKDFLDRVNPKRTATMKTQSFDSIIMECQDMLSIEDKVQEKYEDWLNGGEVKGKLISLEYSDGFLTLVATGFSALGIGVVSLLFTYFNVFLFTMFSAASFAVSWIVLGCISDEYSIKFRKKKAKSTPSESSESSKFQFLKESYSGTINNLNERLELVQNKISEQIRTHQKDREQIQEYSDLLGDTIPIIIKIDSAICDLMLSSDKLSTKKAEINKSLNEYIGESGIITQKEREIERFKVAQELSERMKTNFHTTMEITKSVDVLTDVIMPGLKQLMSLKIPELIEKVNFECDKERVFLEINR